MKIIYLTVQNNHYQAKYLSQIQAWRELGYESQYFNLERTLRSFLQFKKIITNFDVVYIRHGYTLSRVWFFLRVLLCRHKIILEIPTPMHIYYNELDINYFGIKKWLIKKIVGFNLINILKRTSTIIEYAEEELPLVNRYKDKIFLWQNGINSPDLYKMNHSYLGKQKNAINKFQSNKEMHLIVAANLANYHGVDRVIAGLKVFKQQKSDYSVYLHIVSGETKETIALKQTVDKYGLSDNIFFYGKKKLNELSDYYVQMNLAIGPLGSHRKGLIQASALKAREYAYMGLAQCIDYYDYDLSGKDYVLQIERNDSPVDIEQLIDFYVHLIDKYGTALTDIVHDYAASNLLWKHKVIRLKQYLESSA